MIFYKISMYKLKKRQYLDGCEVSYLSEARVGIIRVTKRRLFNMHRTILFLSSFNCFRKKVTLIHHVFDIKLKQTVLHSI